MKIQRIVLSMLCMLGCPYACAMDDPKQPKQNQLLEQAQSQTQALSLATIKKHVNLKRFILELGVILSDDAYEHQQLLEILHCLKTKKLAKLLSDKHAQVAGYFNLEKVRDFILLFAKDDEIAAQQKAEALKKCFKTSAWQKLFGTDDAKTILSCLIDLCYRSPEIPQEKIKVYEAVFTKIDRQKSPLSQYVLIDDIQKILDALSKKQKVSGEHIIKAITWNRLAQDIGITSELDTFLSKDTCVRMLGKALDERTEPSFADLCACIKWDPLIETVLASNKEFFSQIFDTQKLKLVIQKLQNKQPITKIDLLEALSANIYTALESSAITEILRILNFDEFARILNLYFVENTSPTKEVEHYFRALFTNIEKIFGMQLPLAFNSIVPQGVQTSALMTIAERAGDARARYSLPALCYPIPLILLTKALEAKTFLGMFCYLTWTVVTLYVLYRFACSTYSKPLSAKALTLNAVVSNLSSSMIRAAIPWQENSIIEHAKRGYEKHPSLVHFKEFVELLSLEELKHLPSPYSVCELLEQSPAPFLFIDNYTGFIESMCEGNKQLVAARIKLLVSILEKLVKPEDLLITKMFSLFKESLTKEDKQALAAENILSLACYKPAVLYSQSRFITCIAERKTSLTNGPLLTLLGTMKETEKHDPLLHP